MVSILFYIFCFCIFLVEIPVFYAPLYFFSYKVFHIEKKIKDATLAYLLMAITVVLAMSLFPIFFRLVRRILD
jgi:hypothetical protein